MQYQSFGNTKGASDSISKLKALRLPDLSGKRVLDIGCNEGFFCGFALHQGAEEVIGIDVNAQSVEKASIRFPEASFYCQSWDELPEGEFDVIFLLSAIHYAEDQEALIHRLVDKLTPNGVLVLEMGIIPGGKAQWKKIKRSIDERLFPTRAQIAKTLEPYAWKILGDSVLQAGDDVPRRVIHIQRRKPYALLMLANPGMGKTTLTRVLYQSAKAEIISGDRLYRVIGDGRIKAPEALQTLISKTMEEGGFDRVVRAVIENSLMADVVQVWVNEAKRSDCIIDSYVPEEHRETVAELIESHGYIAVNMEWALDQSMAGKAVAAEAAEDYLASLQDPTKSKQFNVTLLDAGRSKEQVHFHLDHPVTGELYTLSGKIRVSGWLLPVDEANAFDALYIKSSEGDFYKTFQCQKSRKDVISVLYGASTPLPDYASIDCGFSERIDPEIFAEGCELGVIIRDKPVALVLMGIGLPPRAQKKGTLGGFLKRVTFKGR